MIEAPERTRRTLDKLFPGVKLSFNERTSRWVLHDELHFHDGMFADEARCITTNAMKGVTYNRLGTRALIYQLDMDGTPIQPILDRIIAVLNRSYSGGRPEGVDHHLDKIEDMEEGDHQSAQDAVQDAAHAAKTASRRLAAGLVTSTDQGFTDVRKRDMAIEKKIRDDTKETGTEEADQFMLEEHKAGRVQTVRD
jgi:hypothetical protein